MIGQGYISQVAVLPGFAHARRNSELVALVSDDPVKLNTLSRTYGVTRIGGYEDFDNLMASGEIDAVYIALPNHLHTSFTLRAARHGIHVLCEKPMAVTVVDCRRMIAGCRRHGVKLMIAYRLHFERANLTAIETVQSGTIGEPRIFNSVFTLQVPDPENIRLRRETGGGTLYDIGIYCINAARSLFQDEPTEVFATTARKRVARFRQVEEMASAILRFPGERLASFTCSFGAARASAYEIVGSRGSLKVSPAFGLSEDLHHTLMVDGHLRERTFPQRDQFAPELLYFSDCILNGVEPEPSGREGLIDVCTIEALYRSAETGRAVKLPRLSKRTRPNMEQECSRPAVSKPKLVHAASPSGKH
ncbi:Gfo/Idh/MocA family protein [Thiobacillus sp.]